MIYRDNNEYYLRIEQIRVFKQYAVRLYCRKTNNTLDIVPSIIKSGYFSSLEGAERFYNRLTQLLTDKAGELEREVIQDIVDAKKIDNGIYELSNSEGKTVTINVNNLTRIFC